MPSIRKAKKALKKCGYEIIRSHGGGKFTVLTPEWKSWMQVYGAPVTVIPSKKINIDNIEKNYRENTSTFYNENTSTFCY